MKITNTSYLPDAITFFTSTRLIRLEARKYLRWFYFSYFHEINQWKLYKDLISNWNHGQACWHHTSVLTTLWLKRLCESDQCYSFSNSFLVKMSQSNNQSTGKKRVLKKLCDFLLSRKKTRCFYITFFLWIYC